MEQSNSGDKSHLLVMKTSKAACDLTDESCTKLTTNGGQSSVLSTPSTSRSLMAYNAESAPITGNCVLLSSYDRGCQPLNTAAMDQWGAGASQPASPAATQPASPSAAGAAATQPASPAATQPASPAATQPASPSAAAIIHCPSSSAKQTPLAAAVCLADTAIASVTDSSASITANLDASCSILSSLCEGLDKPQGAQETKSHEGLYGAGYSFPAAPLVISENLEDIDANDSSSPEWKVSNSNSNGHYCNVSVKDSSNESSVPDSQYTVMTNTSSKHNIGNSYGCVSRGSSAGTVNTNSKSDTIAVLPSSPVLAPSDCSASGAWSSRPVNETSAQSGCKRFPILHASIGAARSTVSPCAFTRRAELQGDAALLLSSATPITCNQNFHHSHDHASCFKPSAGCSSSALRHTCSSFCPAQMCSHHNAHECHGCSHHREEWAGTASASSSCVHHRHGTSHTASSGHNFCSSVTNRSPSVSNTSLLCSSNIDGTGDCSHSCHCSRGSRSGNPQGCGHSAITGVVSKRSFNTDRSCPHIRSCHSNSFDAVEYFNPSCEIHGHAAVAAATLDTSHYPPQVSSSSGNVDSESSVVTPGFVASQNPLHLGSLRPFLPINAANIAVTWASNGSGGLSGLIYTTTSTSGDSSQHAAAAAVSSAHHCCSGRTYEQDGDAVTADQHSTRYTTGTRTSPELGTSHLEGCQQQQQHRRSSHMELEEGVCDESESTTRVSPSSSPSLYGNKRRQTQLCGSSIYGTAANRGNGHSSRCHGPVASQHQQTHPAQPQHHHTATSSTSSSSSNSLGRGLRQPVKQQNLSGSAVSLNSSGSSSSGCGHWCTSCQVKLQSSAEPRSGAGAGPSHLHHINSRCPPAAAAITPPHLHAMDLQPISAITSSSSSWTGLVASAEDVDSSCGTAAAAAADVTYSEDTSAPSSSSGTRRSLKNKMMQKLSRHKHKAPCSTAGSGSSKDPSAGSMTKKKKTTFPFWKTCISSAAKAPLAGPNEVKLTVESGRSGSPSPCAAAENTAISNTSNCSTTPYSCSQSCVETAKECHAEGEVGGHSPAAAAVAAAALPSLPSSNGCPPLEEEASSTPLHDDVATTSSIVYPGVIHNSSELSCLSNSSTTTLPLNYNSVLQLQLLLEHSLRLDLNGPSGLSQERIAAHLDRLQGCGVGESSGVVSQQQQQRTVHTQVDYIHCLVPDLLAITSCTFYWGKMDRYEAESLLENRPEGTFLLRDSAQEEYLFSVSFRRYGKSLHARIEQGNHKFSFDSHDPGVFASDTVCGLIEHYKDPSCCMFFEPMLTNPLCRSFPFPLQHLCRATICSISTYDGINKLKLPKVLRNYLKEYHYKQLVRVRRLDH